MKNMTNSQLIEKSKHYDNVQNEGGEGYNPYRSELERREMEAAATKPVTKRDEIDRLHKKIETECGSVAREWGGNEEIDARQAGYYAEIERLEAEIKAEEDAAFAAEWTLEVTTARRADWNAFVRSLMDRNGKIAGRDMTKIYTRQGKQGWGVEQIKKAVALHNLGPEE